VTDYLIASAKHILAAGPHIFTIAEDLGASAGPFISLPMFREFFLPELHKLVQAVDIPIFFHSCGNINLYMDDIVDLGIAAIHPMQRTAGMDLRVIKEKYGSRLTLVGNVDSSRTLPYGTSKDVERETLECLEIGKPGGRYILASDHSMHDGIPVENITRVFETGFEHGKY
jgi:uroporphyrinogen decarboxylase